MSQPLQFRLQSGLGLWGHTWSTSSPSNPPYSTTFHSFQGLYMCAQVKYRQMGMGRSLGVLPSASSYSFGRLPLKELGEIQSLPQFTVNTKNREQKWDPWKQRANKNRLQLGPDIHYTQSCSHGSHSSQPASSLILAASSLTALA